MALPQKKNFKTRTQLMILRLSLNSKNQQRFNKRALNFFFFYVIFMLNSCRHNSCYSCLCVFCKIQAFHIAHWSICNKINENKTKRQTHTYCVTVHIYTIYFLLYSNCCSRINFACNFCFMEIVLSTPLNRYCIIW